MMKKAFVVIDIQNDITKNYKDIIDGINTAIDWAVTKGMPVVYIKHNNLSAGTRTFKPDTLGAELVLLSTTAESRNSISLARMRQPASNPPAIT